MPLNLIKEYDAFLEIIHMGEHDRRVSLSRIFNRDFIEPVEVYFRTKKINPVRTELAALETLLHHLTTEIVDEKTRARAFEYDRSIRIHWIKHHLLEIIPDRIQVFSSQDPDGIRTYIFDSSHNYVIVLAPYRNGEEYYLLTAYYLKDRNAEKIRKKFKRRLPDIH